MLDAFLQAVKESFGKDLLSVVLCGSAAEGKLRATSDVNLVLVLSSFEQSKADPLRALEMTARSFARKRQLKRKNGFIFSFRRFLGVSWLTALSRFAGAKLNRPNSLFAPLAPSFRYDQHRRIDPALVFLAFRGS